MSVSVVYSFSFLFSPVPRVYGSSRSSTRTAAGSSARCGAKGSTGCCSAVSSNPTTHRDWTSLRNTSRARQRRPPPADRVNFTESGAYSIYNWELYVHAPLVIPGRSCTTIRIEALRWYQRVFDPTATGPDPTPARYWRAQPLYDAATAAPSTSSACC